MPKIWRIENLEGEGVYKAMDENDYFESPIIDHSIFNGHPAPQEDEGIKRCPYPQEICGFKNLKQVKTWFSEYDIQWLKDHGYYLKQINAKITAIGKKQVLAIRKGDVYG